MLALTSMFAQLFERVKVYRLNDGEKWDDKGTGHVSLEYLERSEAVGLVVIDEENNQTLLIHRISADDIYRRQEDTIISWTDPEAATDLALSFQETMSCSYIWDQICNVQRSIQFPSVGAVDPVSRPISDDLEHSGTSQDDDDGLRGGGAEFSGLPPVELGTLPQIVKAVAEVPHFDRDRLAVMILRDNYVRKIIDLFRMCEDLENFDGLHMLFKIVKGIISLNDGRIFDDIFSDANIMDVVGALEYDPDLPMKQRHRDFLKDQVAYKEVVPIRDPIIAAKIHQTYRIGFIKDVILPRVLDDQTFATFNSIMLFNNVAVVTSLQSDSGFISELFLKLWSPETTERSRRDLILFVQEFCNLSKHLQPGLRNQLLGSLVKEGLFDIVTSTLQSSDESVRLSGSDILVVVSNHSPPLLRGFLVEQKGQTLFVLLVKGMLTPGEDGLQSQLLDIMRMLLDADGMDPSQTDKFLDVFYDKYMDQMVEVLTAGCPPKGTSAQHSKQPAPFLGGTISKGEITPEILMSICELMCFCVQHHRFRIKYYVMRNNVVEKILRLTRRKEKYLVVAAVRFLRTCLALKDEFYNRYLVKNSLFQPVIQSFLANGNRYNLLNSAVLELFDFIRKENITVLLEHLVENFSDKLEGIDYADTFQSLKLKYEQSLEGPPPSTRDSIGAVISVGPDHGSLSVRERLNQVGPLPDLRRRKDERALDKDEEDYFNEDSDEEEDVASAQMSPPVPPQSTSSVVGNGSVLIDGTYRGGPFGLVDYEDEDEEAIPAGLGNKNEGSSVESQSEGVLLPALPIADSIWPELEDGPAKRKVNSSLGGLQLGEDGDALAVKKRKQVIDLDEGNDQSSGLPGTREETGSIPTEVATALLKNEAGAAGFTGEKGVLDTSVERSLKVNMGQKHTDTLESKLELGYEELEVEDAKQYPQPVPPTLPVAVVETGECDRSVNTMTDGVGCSAATENELRPDNGKQLSKAVSASPSIPAGAGVSSSVIDSEGVTAKEEGVTGSKGDQSSNAAFPEGNTEDMGWESGSSTLEKDESGYASRHATSKEDTAVSSFATVGTSAVSVSQEQSEDGGVRSSALSNSIGGHSESSSRVESRNDCNLLNENEDEFTTTGDCNGTLEGSPEKIGAIGGRASNGPPPNGLGNSDANKLASFREGAQTVPGTYTVQ